MENTHIKNDQTTSVTSNSETATVAASSNIDNSNTTMTVTGDSDNNIQNNNNTPTSTTLDDNDNSNNNAAFQPFEQLHEAVLAAVNSNTMPPGFIEAAAAAAAAIAHNNSHSEQQIADSNNAQPLLDLQPPMSDVDYRKKESVRASNRERKKKWRIHNEERNKDNDLRCRVNKRANKLHGAGESEKKTQWIKEEFEKRRQKRMDKERRKHIVNNVLSVPGSTTTSAVTTSTAATAATNANTIDNNTNTGSNAADLSNISTAYYSPLIPPMDQETLSKIVDFPTDLHRQLLEQLNNSMLALANSASASSAAVATAVVEGTGEEETDNNTTTATNEQIQQAIVAHSNTESSNPSPMDYTLDPQQKEEEKQQVESIKKDQESADEKQDGGSAGNKKPEYPMDAVLTLMQLNAGWRQ